MHNIINQTSYSGTLLTIEDIVNYSVDNKLSHAFICEDSSLISSPDFEMICKRKGIQPVHGVFLNVEGMGSVALFAKNKQGFSELSKLISHLPKFKMGEKRVLDKETFMKELPDLNNVFAFDGFEGSFVRHPNFQENKNDYINFFKHFKNKERLMYTADKGMSRDERERISKILKKNIKIYRSNISKYKNKEDFEVWQAFFSNKGVARKDKSIDVSTLNNMYAINNDEPSDMEIYKFITSSFDVYDIGNEIKFPILYERKNGIPPLRAKIRDIWKERKEEFPLDLRKIYEKRIKEEIEVIESLDGSFEQYFLFYESLAKTAKSKGFEMTIRGSAGGSLILHLMGLSKSDPIKNKLSFERFLFKGMKGFPDIDLDVSNKAGCVEFLSEHFSDKFYAEIMSDNTVNKVTATSKIILDGYKKLGLMDPEDINQVEKTLSSFSKYLSFNSEKNSASYLKENNYYWKKEMDKSPAFKRVIEDAAKLEGLSVSRSVSVSSSVLSASNLSDYMPVQEGVIELKSENCEYMGLLKIDILSSKMLDRVNKIKKEIGKKWDKKDEKGNLLTLDQYISKQKNVSRLFDYVSDGLTEGVNQIGGDIGRFICKDIKPSNLADLMVVLGLIRMGISEKTKELPEEYVKYKQGKENPENVYYAHKDLKPILSETYGSIIYEEQIMEIAKKIGGFDPNTANAFRKCITKSKDEELLQNHFKSLFFEGAKSNGYEKEIIETIFHSLENKINQFNFSKNHAANYAMIALSELVLKYEYPAEFLNVYASEVKDEESVRIIEEEFKKVGYERKKITLQDIFLEKPETKNLGSKKIISSNLNINLSSDFRKYYADDGMGFDMQSLVINAMPFYAKRSKMLIQPEEISQLKEDFSDLIMAGVFDNAYSHKYKSENILDRILTIRYNLVKGLDDIIDKELDEDEMDFNFERNIVFSQVSESEIMDFKIQCMIKENQISGFSYIEQLSKKSDLGNKQPKPR